MDDPSSYGYLKKACLNQADADIDLSDETAFSKYIKSSADGYDSDIRYYRWFATADLSDKTETVNEILAARHSISPKNVLYYESDGTTEMDVAAAGEKMGAITGMSVEARSSSGSILTLDLTYECGIVKIKTEKNCLRRCNGIREYYDAAKCIFNRRETGRRDISAVRRWLWARTRNEPEWGKRNGKSRYGLSGYLKLFLSGYYRGNNR